MKNEKGITLIALVVTIIVLLILAGVSISMIMGENGIVNRAQDSKEKTKEAELEEEVELLIAENDIEERVGNTTDKVPSALVLKESGEDDGGSYTIYTYKEREFKVYFTEKGNVKEVEIQPES